MSISISWVTLFAAALAYLIGSIPFGLLLAEAGGAGDLRKVGSGNIGATNVLRTGRKGLAAATLLLDLGKGYVATVVFKEFDYSGDLAVVAAAFAVIGHCFPAWLGFKGGKGVATMMGVALALGWQIGLVYAVVWLGVLALTRISSLGGMAAAVSAPIAAKLLGHDRFVIVLVLLAALVLWQHRENIKRLRAGTEPKVGSKGK